MFITLLAILCLVYVHYWWKSRGKVAPDAPPVYPGALPIIGHSYMLRGDTKCTWSFVQKVTSESIKVGGVINFWMGPLNAYVISDPDDAATAANNNTIEKSPLYNFAIPLLGNGLITAPYDIWKVHRKLLNSMFSQKTLNSFISVFNSNSRSLVTKLEAKLDQEPFEYESYISLLNLETICQTAMGVDVAEEQDVNRKFVQAFNDVLDIITRRATTYWLHNDIIYSLSNMKKKEDQFVDVINKTAKEVLLKRKKIISENKFETREDTSDEFKPFIDHLLMAEANNILTDEEVLDEVKTFIGAGYDTNTITLTYILMILGDYQEVQDRVYKELEEIFENSDRDIHKEDFTKMVYMEAVIKETLRLFPTAPIFIKYNNSDVQLSKYTLKANSHIFISTLGICRHPMWGADADQFRPERWLDPASLPDNQNAYPVFGLGKRSCIGRVYAMMSMKTTLAHLLRRYKVTSHNDNVEFKLEVLLRPVTPLRIRLVKRQ